MTGEEMQAMRKSLGLTQKELGDIMGIGGGHVAKMEQGDRAITAVHVAFMRHLLECEMMRKGEGDAAEPFPFTREEGELLIRFKRWLESQENE